MKRIDRFEAFLERRRESNETLYFLFDPKTNEIKGFNLAYNSSAFNDILYDESGRSRGYGFGPQKDDFGSPIKFDSLESAQKWHSDRAEKHTRKQTQNQKYPDLSYIANNIRKIDDLDYSIINRGSCFKFAKEISKLGYDKFAFIFSEEEQAAIHVYVKLTNNLYFDANGFHTKQEVENEYYVGEDTEMYDSDINELDSFGDLDTYGCLTTIPIPDSAWKKVAKVIRKSKMDLNECALVLLPELESALVSACKRGFADSSAIGLSNVAEDILGKRGKETGKDIAFADLDGDKIAFSTERAIWKEFPAEAGIGFSRGVADRQAALQAEKMAGRQKMNIGRWIKAIAGEGHSDADVERLASFLKAHGSRKLGYEKGISEGEDIKRFYTEAAAECRPGSSLYGSCMKDKHKSAPNVFDIYTKNPDAVKIAYMQNAEGKIASRALLWKAEGLAPGMPKELWFMDRIYSADEWMTQEMQKWADQEGWARKKSNIGGRVVIKGQEFRPEMRARIRKIAYKGFPYMDTFSFYATKLGYLYSYSVEEEGLGLQSTHGNYGTATGFMPRARNYIRRFSS